jgi:uncharacterized protein
MRTVLKIALACVGAVVACSPPDPNADGRSDDRLASPPPLPKGHVFVATRDGVLLDTNVMTPRAGAGRAPAILLRTPYPPAAAEQTFRPFTESGYVVVVQSCRGTGASKGVLEPLAQEFDDGQDTARWIARQPWSNGRVGTIGASYEGFTAIAAAIDTPEVRVVIADGAIADGFSGWPLQRGIPMDTGLLWWLQVVRGGPDLLDDPSYRSNVTNTRPLLDLDRRTLGHTDPIWRAFGVEGARRSAFWEKRSLLGKMSRQCAPGLYIQAANEWSDDPLEAFQAATAYPCSSDARSQQRFILGPHQHAGAVYDPFAATPQGELLRTYLDHFLKDAPADLTKVPPVQYFLAGADAWHAAASWPPSASRATFFLDSSASTLDSSAPTRDAYSTLALDPTTQDACAASPESASYASAPFTAPLDIVGAPEVVVTVSTTTEDADLQGVLYEQTASGEIAWSSVQRLRMRFREGYAAPKPMAKGVPTEVHLHFNSAAHRIARGSTLVLTLSATDCGLPENPGTLAPPMSATSAARSIVTLHSGAHPRSRLLVPTVSRL